MCVVLFPQLSQPAVSIDGQVSNPPSTSSTEVNSQQTVPEQQQPPLQEVKMEIKTDEGEPEQTELQMEEKSEVRLSASCWVEYLVLPDALCLCSSHSFQSSPEWVLPAAAVLIIVFLYFFLNKHLYFLLKWW